jgi:hypothetical protein
MTTTTQSAPPSPTRQVPRFELTLAILGAVCGAVVPVVLTAGKAPDPAKLVGLALGAALPLLVGAAGARRPVRVGVVAVLTVAAVALSYSGLQVFAKVTNTEPVVPTPLAIISGPGGGGGGGGGGNGGGGGTTEDALVETSGDLGIKVVPKVITCDADDGCPAVTVTSVGTATLRITSLEFTDDAGSYLAATGCDGVALAKEEQCTITLGFTAENAPESASAHLVIHQNLPEKPTLVPLDAHGASPAEPNLALGPPDCDLSGLIEDPDTGDVSGPVRIHAPLTVTSLPEGTVVDAAVYVDGTESPAIVDLATGQVSLEDFYQGAYPGEVLMVVDPGHLVTESSEDDNVVSCPVP